MASIQTRRKARAESAVEKSPLPAPTDPNMADTSTASSMKATKASRSKTSTRVSSKTKPASAKSFQSLTDTLKDMMLSKSAPDSKSVSETELTDAKSKLDLDLDDSPTEGQNGKHVGSMTESIDQTGPVYLPGNDSFVHLEPTNCDMATLIQAINSMQNTMCDTHMQLATSIELKFDSLKDKLDYLHERFDRQDQSLQTVAARMIDRSELSKIESTLNTVAAQADEKFENIHQDLYEMRSAVEYLRTDNLRLKQRMAMLEEKQNLTEIRDRRFSLTIEGILEVKDKDTKSLLIDKLNSDAEANLEDGDLVSAKRLGKVTKYKKNRTIAVVVRDEVARDKVLKTRGKLKSEVVNTPIWINMELPASYRRRKSMLRDLVKLAISKKYKAKIDRGGINLDGKLYLPHQFHKLPGGLQPFNACCKVTENGGLAFATEWSPLSNLFQAEFCYEDVWFLSADQCYSYQRALFEDKDEIADSLLVTTDPIQCQKLGESFPESEDWNEKREEVMTAIVCAKFAQNSMCMEVLKDTEDATLYDATYDHYWGINSALHAKDTFEEKGKGQNKLGCILLALREGLIGLAEGQLPDTDQGSEASNISYSSEQSEERPSVQSQEEGKATTP